MLLYSLPTFCVALLALDLFSHRLGLFPPGHMLSVDAAELSPAARLADLLRHLALPALVAWGPSSMLWSVREADALHERPYYSLAYALGSDGEVPRVAWNALRNRFITTGSSRSRSA